MARRGDKRRRGGGGRGLALADTGKPVAAADPPQMAAIVKSLAGRRITVEDGTYYGGFAQAWVAPRTADDQWRLLDLDADAIGRYPPHKILELLVDLSPDVSRALFDFLRICNPDWTLVAYTPGTLTISKRAMVALAAIVEQVGHPHGGIDHVFNAMFMQIWLRGALFTEPVFAADGRTLVDLATPDPQTARFRRTEDPVFGQGWELGQFQGKDGYVSLADRPTIRYVPLDPLPGTPYGRPMATPAIFAALFFLGVLHDIRRVVAQQGYSRIDIAIDFAALLESLPEEDAENPQRLAEWVRDAVDQVVRAYSRLEPDDAYVHASTITVNRATGAVNADALSGVTGLIAALERMLVKGLKTMPLLMGMADGISEAAANREIEMQMMGVRAIQRIVARNVEETLGTALRAQGIRATVGFAFSENRAVEALRDEQVLQLKITNAVALYQAGYYNQDQASQHAVGQNADQPAPRGPQANNGNGPGLVNGSVKNPPVGNDGQPADEPAVDKQVSKDTKQE